MCAIPTIGFYFDFACPYAYIALHQLPNRLQGLSWQIHYRPIAASNTPTAADITQAQAQAQAMQLPMQPPAVVPFDASVWLRMALAASPHGQPSRYICTTLLHTIWQHGHNPNDANVQNQAWQAATKWLPQPSNTNAPHAPQLLADNQQRAAQHHIHTSPSFVLQPNTDHTPALVFYGIDALAQLQTAVQQLQAPSL